MTALKSEASGHQTAASTRPANWQKAMKRKNSLLEDRPWKSAKRTKERLMKSDQVLSINVWIDNNSDEELLINDTDRGLVWFLPAGQGMDLQCFTLLPQAEQKRSGASMRAPQLGHCMEISLKRSPDSSRGALMLSDALAGAVSGARYGAQASSLAASTRTALTLASATFTLFAKWRLRASATKGTDEL